MGNGGHVWIFFEEPTPARAARQAGAALVTETMERRPDIGFASYDRFFPNQDTMPIGGFGNLIALPLQRRAREAGNSVLVDEDLSAYDDQWTFLSALKRNPMERIAEIVTTAEYAGRIFGVRTPVEDELADEPWRMPPSRRVEPARITGPLPTSINVTLADEVYVERDVLPPSLVAQFVRLAAFQSPEFYRAQAMRLPTFGKPRITSCAELHPRHLALPRGCLDEASELARGLGIELALNDRRQVGQPLPDGAAFRGELTRSQRAAFADLLPHDCGVLAATTAFGKTVVAIAMIAARQCSTLILVHRRELLDQWVARLHPFLDIDPKLIGVIGGGKRKLGEDVTETLEVIPRQWKVIQTVRECFSCRECETIIQPPAPFHTIPRGFAGPSLLAMVLFEKFGQHQPLNRQSERYAREGIDLSLSTLADHVGAYPAALAPLHALIEAHVLAAERLHGDDTTIPILAKAKTDTGRIWVYVRDDRPFGGRDPPAALFYASRDRTAENPERHLAARSGLLQADAYSGYNGLYAPERKPGRIIAALCWSHARRKFFELADLAAGARRGKGAPPISPMALEAVKRIDAVFDVERNINGLSADERLRVRSETSAPLLAALETWLRAERAKLSRHAAIAKAID